MSPKKFPICGGMLNDGANCRTIVVNPESDDPLERDFCAHHGNKRRDTHPEAVEAAPETPLVIPAAAPDELELLAASSAPESVARRGSPRETLRRFAEENPDKINAVFEGVLNAEREVWRTCGKCGKRTEVTVPDWAARTRAVQMLLAEGFGKPDPAPRSEDDVIAATVIRHLESLSDKQLAIIAAGGGYEDNGDEAA